MNVWLAVALALAAGDGAAALITWWYLSRRIAQLRARLALMMNLVNRHERSLAYREGREPHEVSEW